MIYLASSVTIPVASLITTNKNPKVKLNLEELLKQNEIQKKNIELNKFFSKVFSLTFVGIIVVFISFLLFGYSFFNFLLPIINDQKIVGFYMVAIIITSFLFYLFLSGFCNIPAFLFSCILRGITIFPLYFLLTYHEGLSIFIEALLATTGVFSGVCIYALFSKQDFSKWYSSLFSICWGMFYVSIMNLLVLYFVNIDCFNIMNLFQSFLIIIVSIVFIMAHISNLKNIYTSEQKDYLSIYGASFLIEQFVVIFVNIVRLLLDKYKYEK